MCIRDRHYGSCAAVPRNIFRPKARKSPGSQRDTEKMLPVCASRKRVGGQGEARVFLFVKFYGIDSAEGGRYNRFIWRAFHLICGRSAEKSRKYKIV